QRFAEQSYQLAHELYQKADALELAPEERTWVSFRLADTRWRSAAATNDPDASALDRSADELRHLLEPFERPESRTDLFADVHESLGDMTWRANSQDWSGAWSHYSAALEYWADSSDLERARPRWLAIVWRAAMPPWQAQYYGQGWFPSYL